MNIEAVSELEGYIYSFLLVFLFVPWAYFEML